MATEIASSQGLETLAIVAPSQPISAEALPVITQLVPVVWELITRYITGADVISVCSSLSKPMWLRFRLGFSGDFIIRPTEPIPPSPAFYSFLQYLPRLTSISLYNSNLNLWRSGPRVFELFPSSIRSISLNIPFHFDIWLIIPRNTPLEDPKDATVASNKSRRVSKRQHLLSTAPSFDLRQKFPVLEVLIIRASNSKSQVHNLPSDLRTYGPAMKTAKKNFLKGLPPSLQRVSLPSLAEETDKMISLLPDGLLDVEYCVDGTMNGSSLKFPSNLRRLAIEVDYAPGSALICSKMIDKLPHTLETLEWIQKPLEMDSSQLHRLASHPLKSLIFHHSIFADPDLSLFSILPRSLTSLELVGRECAIGTFSELPRTLISFNWTSMARYPSYALRQVRYYDWENLPRDLEVLELRDMFIMTDLDYKILPRTITRLVLSISPCYWPCHDCGTMDCRKLCEAALFDPKIPRAEEPSDLIALDLPPKLVYLHIMNTYFGPRFFQNLPMTLETLDVDTRALLDESTFTQLPAKLKVLNLERTPRLKYEALNFLPTDELRELKVWNGSLAGESFCMLPRSLTRLQVDDKRSYCDKHIKDLPRGLLHFICPQADQLTTRCAADLPRGLLTFKIAKIIIEDPRPTRMQLVLAFPTAVPAFDLHYVTAKGRRVNLETLV